MLRVADRQQGFFDAAWCADLLPAKSIYVQDFAQCYSECHGRPSIPPSLLSKVLLLAFRDGLSDERAMQAVRFDLRWKVALDLPVDHPGFHPTSLVRFRARLLLHGKERLVFERSIELATELGLLEGRPSRSLIRRRCSVPRRCRKPLIKQKPWPAHPPPQPLPEPNGYEREQEGEDPGGDRPRQAAWAQR